LSLRPCQIEMVKSRMQVQGEFDYRSKPFANSFEALKSIGRLEGVRGLQAGTEI
jgi:hypothetical protein